MAQMAWLSHLVETENEKELIEFLGDKGFKNPKFAAKEFLKAGRELKEDKEKKFGNKNV
jgi:hypothetical protein|tara:strand:- start:296 stop:472 length:177 start_codon:yes stop_codon:yes gene_type:complete